MEEQQLSQTYKKPFVGGRLTLVKGALATRRCKAYPFDTYFIVILHANDGTKYHLNSGSIIGVGPKSYVFLALRNDDADHINKFEVLAFREPDNTSEEENLPELDDESIEIERSQITAIRPSDATINELLVAWSTEHNRLEIPLFLNTFSFRRDMVNHKKFITKVVSIILERHNITITDEILKELVEYPKNNNKKKKEKEGQQTDEKNEKSKKKRDRAQIVPEKGEEINKKRKIDVFVSGRHFTDVIELVTFTDKIRDDCTIQIEKERKARQEAELKLSRYEGIMIGKGWTEYL
jgi:hypothetical protein